MTPLLPSQHRSPRLATGLAFLLLAPLASAQLADMELVPGALGTTESPVFADLEGDGDLDIVLFTRGDLGPDMAVFRMDGAGSYGFVETLIPSVTGTLRTAFLPEDIDGDGDLDLWVSERTLPSQAVLVAYMNLGPGPFAAGASYPTGIFAETIQRLDVDGDGISDLSLDTESQSAGFLRGQPGGSLLPFQTYLPSDYRHGALRLGDLDGDGDADLIGLRAEVAASFLLRTYSFENTGSFPIDPLSGVQLITDTSAAEGTLSDFDEDGDLDAILVRSVGGTVDLFVNSGGTLTFSGVLAQGLISTQQVVGVDAEGDGDIDLVYRSGVSLVWRENLPGPLFAPDQVLNPDELAPERVADINGDGLSDHLFLSSFPGQSASLYLRLGEQQAGIFVLPNERIDLSDSPGRDIPAVFDADANGLEDLVYVGNGELGWKRATGGGSYALTETILEVPLPTIPPVAGDFDGDGLDDVVYTSAGSSALAFLKGDGSGGFDAPTLSPIPSAANLLVSADLNSDGIQDVIVTRSNGSAVGVMRGTSSGQFEAMTNVSGNFAGSVVPVPIDADGDGRLDLMFATGEVVELALQTQSGGFPSRSVVVDTAGLATFPVDLLPPIAGDIDSDGILDIVIAFRNTIRSASGNGDGTFGPLQLLVQETGSFFEEIQLTRVDANASRDLIARKDSSGSPPLWAPSQGPASFGAFQVPDGLVIDGLSAGARSVRLVDVDGDGDRDIISTSNSNGYLLTRNAANETVGANYCGPAVPNSTGLAGVMAADGSTDIAVNQLTLLATDLPQNQFGFFVLSQTQGLVTTVPNSEGTLCLGGAIGRFNRPDEIQFSGSDGAFSLDVDLAAVPSAAGDIPVLPGQTWYFQAWFRDIDGMVGQTSNFTDGLEISF